MRILIPCEESQAVCKAFRARGHEAFSCDLQPCSGGHPEWHIQGDVFDVVDNGWDMMIAFPPCTDLAVSGSRWFSDKREDGSQYRSICFFIKIARALQKIGRGGIENPIGIMSGNYILEYYPNLDRALADVGFPSKPTQIIQPWQFGHGETKATCLWLHNIPALKPTNIVEGREQRIWRMPPGPDRAKERSKTYQGIADAMADQWGDPSIFPAQTKQLSLIND